MSNRPIEETISCLAVNTEESLPNANIKYDFLIELVIVTDSWETCVPTAPHVRLGDTDEGQKIRVFIECDTLKRTDKEEIDPVLQAPCVLQAIRQNSQIGRTWIVQ